MYIRYTITISGKNFAPTQIRNLILENLKIVEIFDCYHFGNCFGILQVQHIDEFVHYYNESYENDFINFFERNFEKLKLVHADEFSLFMEIYYHGQCNFEIFDNKKLNILARYDVSIPVSVYHVDSDWNGQPFN